MSSNPLMMGYEGGDLTAVKCCLCLCQATMRSLCVQAVGGGLERPGGSDQ